MNKNYTIHSPGQATNLKSHSFLLPKTTFPALFIAFSSPHTQSLHHTEPDRHVTGYPNRQIQIGGQIDRERGGGDKHIPGHEICLQDEMSWHSTIFIFPFVSFHLPFHQFISLTLCFLEILLPTISFVLSECPVKVRQLGDRWLCFYTIYPNTGLVDDDVHICTHR